MGRGFRFYGERPVPDPKLILKVDDLINIATGSKDKNVVDLKMLQFILYTLAGHVNILEQMVELRIPKSGDEMEDENQDKKRTTGGKQDIETRLDKDTDRERRGGKDDDYGRGHARRVEGKERQGRDIGKYGIDKERKSSESDVEYEKEARGRSYDEGHRKKYSTHRGRNKQRGDYDEDSDEDEGTKGKEVDERGRGRGRRRTRSLDIDITSGGRRRSRDESLDKDDQRHGSLGRTERQGISEKLSKKFSDTRNKIAKKTQGKDVGSFLVQVKQKHILPGRVSGVKTGKHRQYDADSAGGGVRDDKYQEGSGRKCDTGKGIKGAKTDEGDDDNAEELKNKLEKNESLEAGGLWKCTGRENQDSFEEIEGTLLADSKGNMKFVPLDDGKKKGKGRRDKKSYKDKGKDERVGYDRDIRSKHYDRYYRDGRDAGRRGGKYDDRDNRDDWDRDDDGRFDGVGRKGGRDSRREVDDEVRDGRYDKEYDRDDRDRRGGREGRYDRKKGRDFEEHSWHRKGGKGRVKQVDSASLKSGKRGLRGTDKGVFDGSKGGNESDEDEHGRRKRKGYDEIGEGKISRKKGDDTKGKKRYYGGSDEDDGRGGKRKRRADGDEGESKGGWSKGEYSEESDEGDSKNEDSGRLTDEDDSGGRGGAGKGAGREKTGDKGAASQKGLKGRDATGQVGRDGSIPRVGSIEVVTRTQFHELEKAVEELQKKAGPMAPPILPGNKQLLSDIAMGNASLTDVIQALQLQARLQAAERAIDRLADLIAQLAAAGALTPEMLAKVAAIHSEVEQGYKELSLGPGGKAELAKQLQQRIAEGSKVDSAGISAILGTLGATGSTIRRGGAATGEADTGRGLSVPPSSAARPSSVGLERPAKLPTVTGSTLSAGLRSLRSGKSLGSKDCVTAAELEEALQALREDFLNKLGNITANVNATADSAAGVANAADSKLTRVMTMNDRVSILHSLVNDYTDQLHGFDVGVQTQLQSFQQQLEIIKGDLQEGLHELHYITNSADTAAVVELKEQYQLAADDLDDTRNSHKKLLNNQEFLTSEIKDIAKCIEEFNDQKADMDEVLDGLRDKADASRLAGLLTLEDFRKLYEELGMRMQMCYDKFRSQDAVWMTAVQEINEVISAKATAAQLGKVQEDAQEQFKELNRKALLVKRILGDPKASLLTRKLTKGAISAARTQAPLMEVSDVDVDPSRQPGFRPRPTGADDDVCLREVASPIPNLTAFEDETCRQHICKRWCGGSHTLLSSSVTRESAADYTFRDMGHTRRYMGVGTDNKLYNLVDQCQPCQECNAEEKIPGETEETSPHPGAGDQGDGPTVVTGKEARRVTIVADADIQLTWDGLVRKRRGLERKRSSGGVRRPLEEFQDIHDGHDDMIPRKANDVGVIVKGQITVFGDDTAHCAPGCEEHVRICRSNLAQERIREQFEAPMPHSNDADFISKAIAALSEL